MMTLLLTLFSAFEIGIGAGYGTLGAKSGEAMPGTQVNTPGSWSMSAHAGYSFFFCDYVGIGVGADVTRHGQRIGIDGEQVWRGVIDTDGERYDHHMILNGWSEAQETWYIEIPVSLKANIPAGRVYIMLEAGGKYGLPISTKYSGSGTTTHYGYYEPWDLTLRDMPDHGYYTEEGFRPTGEIEGLKNRWSVFGKVGVGIPLNDWLDLTAQLYGQYALTAIGTAGGEENLGFRNDRPGQAEAHYFMSDYTSALHTQMVKGDMKPWNIGVEIGLRFVIPHRQKECWPCKINTGYKVL